MNQSKKRIAIAIMIFMALLIYPASQWIQQTGTAIHESTFASIESDIYLEVPYGDTKAVIRPFQTEGGNLYFFLPSFVDTEKATLCLDETIDEIALDGTTIKSGVTLDGLHIKADDLEPDAHTLTIGGDVQSLIFMQSASIPALFLRTKSGSLDDVEEIKEIHEGLLADAVDAEGHAVVGMKPEYIKGHGNTSYQRDKKPYQIKFTNPVSFFGLGAQEKWILLANRLDPSYMRNFSSYELGRALELDAPESCFVDLYINGEYRGNYQLTQKPEIAAAETLLEHNYGVKLDRREYHFETKSGEGFVIRWPDIIPDNRMELIRSIVQRAEDEIIGGFDNTSVDENKMFSVVCGSFSVF